MLRHLHHVMASEDSAQLRLDQIVTIIAENLKTEVCSIYLARAGGVLELFATEGLKAEAVHQTRLHFGEGLVGLVAESGDLLNLSDAPTHPSFVYRPETGEEIYHAFLGVPILRGGKSIGVLVIQNIAERLYEEEEAEVLQTIAMVLAELVASGDLVSSDELAEDASKVGHALTLDGMALSDGVGMGKVVFHETRIKITRWVSDNAEQERIALEKGIDELRAQLEALRDDPDLAQGGEHREVLETYRMFAYDRGWQRKMREAVETGLTAEGAVERVQQENSARMMKTNDSYLRERMQDLDNLANRLIRIIMGVQGDDRHELLVDSVLIARTMGPAELLDYDRTKVKAVVLEEGSPNAHMTIVARALGIPVIGRVIGLRTHVEEGDQVVVDSETEHVYIRPTEDILDIYAENILARDALAAEYASERTLPFITKDGTELDIFMNAGLLVDLPRLDDTGAKGIGLFRTEFQFMVSTKLPRVTQQQELYEDVLNAAGDRPVVFRTLDVGGDKKIAFLPREENEENPAMGWRAIRISLDRPALLRYQLRALLYSAKDRELNIMFPMIAEIQELRGVKAIYQKEVDRMIKNGDTPPANVKLGCMLEVPSLAWQLDLVMEEIDFISIGTNDLMQFFFACDRSSPKLAGRYDLLAPSVLSFLKTVVDSGKVYNVPITLCGEMGGKPLEAMALLGLGMTRLSVSPSAVGAIRKMARTLDLQKLKPFMEANLKSDKHSLREQLILFAKDHNIYI